MGRLNVFFKDCFFRAFSKKLAPKFQHSKENQKGQTLVEYIVLLALIIGMVMGLKTLMVEEGGVIDKQLAVVKQQVDVANEGQPQSVNGKRTGWKDYYGSSDARAVGPK